MSSDSYGGPRVTALDLFVSGSFLTAGLLMLPYTGCASRSPSLQNLRSEPATSRNESFFVDSTNGTSEKMFEQLPLDDDVASEIEAPNLQELLE